MQINASSYTSNRTTSLLVQLLSSHVAVVESFIDGDNATDLESEQSKAFKEHRIMDQKLNIFIENTTSLFLSGFAGI